MNRTTRLYLYMSKKQRHFSVIPELDYIVSTYDYLRLASYVYAKTKRSNRRFFSIDYRFLQTFKNKNMSLTYACNIFKIVCRHKTCFPIILLLL